MKLALGRGQRIGLFAGSGVGKSVLLGMMARYTSADVIVVGLIGAEGLLISALLLQHRRRRRAEMAVRERLDFETLVSVLSATFVGMLGAEIDEGIEHGLRRVGEHLRLDRSLILDGGGAQRQGRSLLDAR